VNGVVTTLALTWALVAAAVTLVVTRRVGGQRPIVLAVLAGIFVYAVLSGICFTPG
jgi:hypothetical protein